VAWGALLSGALTAVRSAAGSALSYVGSAGSSILRAAASPSGQALLKGALDLGVGIAGSVLSRSPSGIGGATGLTLGNPLAVNRQPYGGATAYTPGINPNVSLGRSFYTSGDLSGGTSMALLGAPVLTAARSVLGGIASRAGSILTGTTARGVAGGALGAAAVEAAGGLFGGGPGMPGLFNQGMPRATPIRRIIQQNPVTGQLAVWEYAGHPVLYSRDLAVARRVARIMGRPAPRGGRRRSSRRFR
jgi:hypothetical protein